MESYQKEVNISRLAGSAAPVVVKALQNAGAFAFGHRESDIAYFELLSASCGRDDFREISAGKTMKNSYRHAW